VSDWIRAPGFLLGLAIVAATSVSVFSTLIVPRATSSRMLRSVSKVLAKGVRTLMTHSDGYESRDRLMSVVGPLGMILLFGAWVGLLIVGFGLMVWLCEGTSLLHALDIAGSSVFTLGVTAGQRSGSKVIEVVAAGAGLLIVALEIAYLPTLYGAFKSRETEVTLLATRAGTPAWGPEVLTRHHWFRTTSELPELYRTWERWSADVAESHTNYPSLLWFRSPVASRSWLTALTAVLDACALHDAVAPSAAPSQARICLQMGRNCLRAMAGTLKIPYNADPLPTDPIRLTREEFALGYARLVAVGFPLERDEDDAWTHFVGWRVNYESIVDALTMLVMPPPAPWFLPRPHLGPFQLPRVLDRTPSDPQAAANPE
jgi:hypothetical protein